MAAHVRRLRAAAFAVTSCLLPAACDASTSSLGATSEDCHFQASDAKEWHSLGDFAQAVTNQQVVEPVLVRNDFHWKEEFASRDSFLEAFGNMSFSITKQPDEHARVNTMPSRQHLTVAEWMAQLDKPDSIPFVFYRCGEGPECITRIHQTYGIPEAMQNYSSEVFMPTGRMPNAATWLRQMIQFGRAQVGYYHQAKDLEDVQGVRLCTQQPDDMVFLPALWWHATANVGDWTLTIGGQEYSSGAHYEAVVGDVRALKRRSAEELKAMDSNGRRPMHVAAYHGHVPVLEFLTAQRPRGAGQSPGLQSGDGTERHDPQRPIHFAASNGQAAACECLIEQVAKPTMRKGFPQPLCQAAENDHAEVARVFLRNGVEVDLVDPADDDYTPLLHAAKRGHVAVIKVLLEHGADENLAPQSNILARPLHKAAAEGHAEATLALLEAGADPLAKKKGGRTALSIAKKKGHEQVVEILKAAKTSKTRNTPKGSPRKPPEGEL